MVIRKTINPVVRKLIGASSGGSGIPTDYESFHSFSADWGDATGNHNATPTNASIVGGRAVFTTAGPNSYATAASPYPATSAVTVSLIVELDNVTGDRTIFADGNGGNASFRVALYTRGTKWNLSIGDGVAFWLSDTIDHNLLAGVRYEIQYEINGTSVKLRVDGVEVVNTTSTVALSTSSGDLWTFARLGSFNGFFLDGKIEEVYRYHRVLTAAEQAALTARK